MKPSEQNQNTDALNNAGDALQALADGPARQAADAIAESFAIAGKRISTELARAARSGEFSFNRMVQSILNDLARIAINKVIGGAISGIFSQAGGGFSGTRAEGGPVLPGGAYLVGERGPEVFKPASAGSIETGIAQPGIVVNFNLGAGSNIDSFRRSQGQISALLARAVENGRSRL
jgi:lambda family phage tail tape measure protein